MYYSRFKIAIDICYMFLAYYRVCLENDFFLSFIYNIKFQEIIIF